jgi:predicted alpha-1,2-mannosidase
MSADAGDAGEAQRLAQQSLNYRNLLDADSGFIRPRHDDGAWLTPFAPELGYGFQEGTSWQYSWLAMHDLAGIVAGMGGNAEVQRRLDTFFLLPSTLLPGAWPFVQNQLTLFGLFYAGNQYAPGNEHDLQAPYVYNYAGAPWKSQLVARSAGALFAPTPLGLPGNDDLGALSGWLAWTLIGLYPMNPGTPLYVVGSPVFETVMLHRPDAPLRIEAPGAGPLNAFVNGLAVDDSALAQPWLTLPRHAATVRLQTSVLPDTAWGADAPPPSLSTAALDEFGCHGAAR